MISKSTDSKVQNTNNKMSKYFLKYKSLTYTKCNSD